MFSKRINIFTGHFGSGKTEVAVNYALKLSEMSNRTAIVDFDIVNPYFRTMDVKEYLENKGVWVIAPAYANTNVDVPALPPEINTLLENKDYRVVFDVGGDDLGATALSRYKEEILQEDYGHFFVVNIKRLMTNTVEKIEEMFFAIEKSSGLKIKGIVNNTNLLGATTVYDLLESKEVIEKAALKLGVPVMFTSILSTLFKDTESLEYAGITGDILYMEKMIHLPWEKGRIFFP
ncbi:MAG: hypothetical protein HPY74_03660 [Firmicutes bacterium]|nr:hypothetical protein [Bacillota bacterium]